MKKGIYIASKIKHGEKWKKLREKGLDISSTWINESGVGETKDFTDLWIRCINEVSSSKALILYREPHEELKGAWVEVGAAIVSNIPIFAVGIHDFTIKYHPKIVLCQTLDEAIFHATNRCKNETI